MDTSEMILPYWAVGLANGVVQEGAQLCTRDGRKTGNAVVCGPKVSEHGNEYWTVLTDAGTEMLLNDAEVNEMFWPPMFVMAPETAPGKRG
jgi:hypothetical protein